MIYQGKINQINDSSFQLRKTLFAYLKFIDTLDFLKYIIILKNSTKREPSYLFPIEITIGSVYQALINVSVKKI